MHDRWDLGAVDDRVGERLVDLQDVDGELPQVAERRVARTEVVDCNAHAEGAQVLEAPGRGFGILNEHAFGHLQDHLRCGESGSHQGVGDVADDVGCSQSGEPTG